MVRLTNTKRTALKYRDIQYKLVEEKTGVPWHVVAGIHMRESNADFKRVLHNGEKIIGTNQKTKYVPIGRGPFATWIDSAIDVINFRQLNLVTDWSLENTLKICEAYNGRGYLLFHKDVQSPYLWSCTNNYVSGLYDSDGNFDPALVDRNCGIAALFKCLDGEVNFKRAAL